MELTSDQIGKLIQNYKNKRVRENNFYHNVQKNNPAFMEKNRERAKTHYQNNKTNKAEQYLKDKEARSAKSLYNYYKKKDQGAKFEEKYADRFELLKSKNMI